WNPLAAGPLGADGTHAITLTATDKIGNTNTSGPVNVSLDNTPPSVSITSPTNGATIQKKEILVASVSDANPPATVTFDIVSIPPGKSFTGNVPLVNGVAQLTLPDTFVEGDVIRITVSATDN